VPHTENSVLAKRIRNKLKVFEEISTIRVKLVERTGEKLCDILHKSNPWEAIHCPRDDCIFCSSKDEKLIGKCKKRNIVYETECQICKEEMREEEERTKGADMPSSKYGQKHGMVKEVKGKEKRGEDCDGAEMPSSQYRKNNGMVKEAQSVKNDRDKENKNRDTNNKYRDDEEKKGAEKPSRQYRIKHGMVNSDK